MEKENDLDNNIRKIWCKYNYQIKKGAEMNEEQVKEIIRTRTRKVYRVVNWGTWYSTAFILPLTIVILYNTMLYRPTWDFWLAAVLVVSCMAWLIYYILKDFISIRKIEWDKDSLVHIMQRINLFHYRRLKARKNLSYMFPVFCAGVYLWGTANVSLVTMLVSCGLIVLLFCIFSRIGDKITQRRIAKLEDDIRILEDLS